MHSADDVNYNRGYEWWLMTEAKKVSSWGICCEWSLHWTLYWQLVALTVLIVTSGSGGGVGIIVIIL